MNMVTCSHEETRRKYPGYECFLEEGVSSRYPGYDWEELSKVPFSIRERVHGEILHSRMVTDLASSSCTSTDTPSSAAPDTICKPPRRNAKHSCAADQAHNLSMTSPSDSLAKGLVWFPGQGLEHHLYSLVAIQYIHARCLALLFLSYKTSLF